LDPYWFKLLITFCVGSLWVTLTTIVADRFGSEVGGWIGGLPSTIVVTLFFAGRIESTQVASNVTSTVSLAIGINSLFLLAYTALAPMGFAIAIGGSILDWLILASLPVIFSLNNFALAVFASLVASSFAYFLIRYIVHSPPQPSSEPHHGSLQLAFRAVFGGFVTALAVALTRLGGPILGGIFAVFPAVFISTLAITYHSQGVEFSRAITKSLLPSGVLTVLIYAIAARYLFLIWGIFVGTLGAYAVSILSAYFLFRLIGKRT
jgi:hypothetical protein